MGMSWFRRPTLILAAQLLFIVVTLFHADGKAIDQRWVFAEYARSGSWKAVHLVQFAAVAILLAGLLALFFAANVPAGPARWASRLGAASTVVALAVYGVLQAVDGVGKKMVDAAWVSALDARSQRASPLPKPCAGSSGVRSYQDFAQGLALLLLAAAVARTGRLPRPIAYLMGLSGLTYLVQGWVIGAEGFSGTHSTLILVAYVFSLAWMIWLLIVAWRMKDMEARRPAGVGVNRPAAALLEVKAFPPGPQRVAPLAGPGRRRRLSRQRVREVLGVVGLDQVAVTCRWAFDRSSDE